MKHLKRILVIIFMIALNFVPEAIFSPSHSVNGKEIVIQFSPFTDISMISFWQIWVVKITGIIYFVMLCLLLAEYITVVVKKQKRIEKLFSITKKILIFWIAFRLIFALCQRSDFYGVKNEEVYFSYRIIVYLFQLFLAHIIIINTDENRAEDLAKTNNKSTYILYTFLLELTCSIPYSMSTTYDIEGYIGSRMYTIFRSENTDGLLYFLDFLSGYFINGDPRILMLLILTILAGIMHIKRFEQKILICIHKTLNIATIMLLVYTSGFCVFSQWFEPAETVILEPITAVCLGVGINLLFMEIPKTHGCEI